MRRRPAAAAFLAALALLLPARPALPAVVDGEAVIQKSFRNENLLTEGTRKIEARIPGLDLTAESAKIEGVFDNANLVAMAADTDDPYLPLPEEGEDYSESPNLLASSGTLIDTSRRRAMQDQLPDVANLYFEGIGGDQAGAPAAGPADAAYPLLTEVIETRERMESKLGYVGIEEGYSDRGAIDKLIGGEGDDLLAVSRKLDLSLSTLKELNRQISPFVDAAHPAGRPERKPRDGRPPREDEVADEESETPAGVSGSGFAYPVVAKRISSRFGWRIHPIYGRRKYHNGLDLAANYGRAIVAASAGVVEYAGWKSYYGKTVVVRHPNGLKTLYAHCSKLIVARGQKVNRGARIAAVGQSGLATGPHLHFGVMKNGAFVDPLPYLR